MGAIPTFILNLILPIVLKFGLPWLISKFPWIPPSWDAVITNFLQQQGLIKMQMAQLHMETADRIKKECFGVCPPETKS